MYVGIWVYLYIWQTYFEQVSPTKSPEEISPGRKYCLYFGYIPTMEFTPFHADIGSGLLHPFILILFARLAFFALLSLSHMDGEFKYPFEEGTTI